MMNTNKTSLKEDGKKISLSEDELSELRDAFNLYDKNQNGYISTSELGLLLRSLGQNPTEKELMNMINEVDTDDNQQVDFEEFTQLMTRQAEEADLDMDEQVHEMIRVYDYNRTGYISTQHLRLVLLGHSSLSEDDTKKLLSTMDPNNEGKIEYQAFADFISSG